MGGTRTPFDPTGGGGAAGGAGGPGGGGVPPYGPAPAPERGMEDLYVVRVGLDAGDAQAGFRTFVGQFRDLAGQTTRSTTAIGAGFNKIRDYVRLLGIDLTAAGLVRQILEVEQLTRDLRRGMYDATREATRGGGAMLAWTQANEEVYRRYASIAAEARVEWRRSEQEINSMFQTVSRAGLGAMRDLEGNTRDLTEVLDELGEAVTTGFQLQFLGLSPQQIQSMYHSMAVNLRMDIGEIQTALHQLFVVSQSTAFSWQEHVRYVTQALAQYSKIGVTLEEVTAYMIAMQEGNRRLSESFDNIGMVYELMMDRLGVRRQIGAEQMMRMFEMVSPQQLRGIVGEAGLPEYQRRLVAAQRDLPTEMQFTTEELFTRRLAPLQYMRAWTAMSPGMMNLMRYEAMQTTMAQLGPQGRLAMPVWAERMPEFRTFFRQFQAGMVEVLDPEEMRRQLRELRDAPGAMNRRTFEAVNEARQQRGQEELPKEYLRSADARQREAKAFFTQVGGYQREIIANTQGILRTTVHYWNLFLRGMIGDKATREALMRRSALARAGETAMTAGGLAAAGAGIGAMWGAAGGTLIPIPVVGTVGGALGGAILGGLGGLIAGTVIQLSRMVSRGLEGPAITAEDIGAGIPEEATTLRPAFQITAELPIPLPVTIAVENLLRLEGAQRELLRTVIPPEYRRPREAETALQREQREAEAGVPVGAGYRGQEVEAGTDIQRLLRVLLNVAAAPRLRGIEDVPGRARLQAPGVPEAARYPTTGERLEQMLERVSVGRAREEVREEQEQPVNITLHLTPEQTVAWSTSVRREFTKSRIEEERLGMGRTAP